MRVYLTNIAVTLRLMTRDRMALFFGYIFPLVFFFLFAQMTSAGQGAGLAKQVVTSVLIFGVLGNGFFGAGMRAVSDREQNILRRFKVAPTDATPLLISWLVTGLVSYLPSAVFLIGLGHFGYQMPWPERPVTLFVFLSVAVLAFRALGLIIASVVNSMQESQVLIQLCYLPMLFLSGATFPLTAMPKWLQILAQFVPSSHLFSGLQAILIRQEGLLDVRQGLGALVMTIGVALFLARKLFRWEKEEKVPPAAKLWVIGAMAPFLVLGVLQSFSMEAVKQSKVLQRQLRRSRTLLIRDVRLFVGDGKVIERGGLLVREGRISAIYEGDSPDAKQLQAEAIDGSGKTLLPGLIDTAVLLSWPGGSQEVDLSRPDKHVAWGHVAYLYSGVTTIRTYGDPLELVREAAQSVERGERLASTLLYTGPIFTTRAAAEAGPLGTLPGPVRDRAFAGLYRFPSNSGEATSMAAEIREGGATSLAVDTANLNADIVAALRETGLPLLANHGIPGVHTVAATDAPGGARFWAPSLTAHEAENLGRAELLDRSLVQQVAPKGMIARTRPMLAARAQNPAAYQRRSENIPRFLDRILSGSGSGRAMVTHGPGVHREMALLVQAGMTPEAALSSATAKAADALGIGNRTGRLKTGLAADLVLVDGNPLREITDTERISLILFRGERVNRANLFEDMEE